MCPSNTLSSTCHFSFLAAPDTDHQHKFSLNYLTYLTDNFTNTHTQDLRYTMNIYPAMFHGRVADQHKSHLPQFMSPSSSRPKGSNLKTSSPEKIELDRNLGTDPYQIHEKFLRSDFQNLITEDMDDFWKSWCRDVLLPVSDAFRLRLSGEHCRLGS